MCGLDELTECRHHIKWSNLPLKKRPIYAQVVHDMQVVQDHFITSFWTHNTQNHGFKHLSDPKYKCSECGKAFSNGVRYRAHLRRHESKRSGRYRCLVCLKTFVQNSSLTTHLRIHSGEKPFFCTECFNQFGDFSTYTKHKRTHSGEKPYACRVCYRSFSQSGNMHRHEKTVHRLDSPSPPLSESNSI